MNPQPTTQAPWRPALAGWSDALLPISLLPLLLHPGEQPIGMALVILAWLAIKLLQRTESQPYNWLFLFLLSTQLEPILSSAKYPASTFSDLLLPITAFVAGFGQDQRSWWRGLLMVLAIIPVGIVLLRPVTFAPGLWPILTLIDVNRNRTAFLFGLAAVIAICLASRLPERQPKRWIAAAGILGYLACLATGSRAGAVLPVVATGLALWAARRFSHKNPRPAAQHSALKPIVIGATISTLLAAILLSWYSPLAPNFQRNQLSDFGRVAVTRCFIEQAGRDADTLLRGVGQGKDRVAKLCQESTPWARKGEGLAHAHNNFAQLLAENGLPALLLAIGLLAGVAKASSKALKEADEPTDQMLSTASVGILIYILLYAFADGTLIRLPLQQVLQGYLLALPFAPALSPKEATRSQP